jgi:uncharacterized protein DUF6600/FecR-like protein
MRGLSVFALMALTSASAAVAYEDDFSHGRIRYVEGGVTLQRSTEGGSEEAAPNLPFLPGDRVWTDEGGRAEFQFPEGTLLRLDSRGKLDYVAHEEGREERIVLRLWSGGLMLRSHDGRAPLQFALETPGGIVEAQDGAVLRLDVEAGEARLSVYDGNASLDSGRRRVEVGAGERAYARRGEAPEGPQRFDRRESDDFAEWNRDRDERENWAGDTRRYLPEEVTPYAAELESHGDWYYEAEVGYVWRPFVAAGWRPYSDGRWVWSAYGWTWVPNEAWGWAPSHYGRWGYSLALGWYWIPGSVWGPAWVSWAVGGDYVGWCPLGRGDHPVAVDARPRDRAVPRGSLAVSNNLQPWTYARKGDITARDLPRRRLEMRPSEIQTLRVTESPTARPSRDFTRVAEAPVPRERAVPRGTSLKPTIGDTVPELRYDPTTQIPITVPRRRPREGDDPHFDRPPTARGAREAGTTGEARGSSDALRDRPRSRWSSPDGGDGAAAPVDGRHPTDTRSPSRAPAATPRGSEERARPTDSDRDVLRRMFRPLTESRPGGDARSTPQRAEPRTAPPPRSAPAHATPPPQPRPPAEHAQPRPPKEKDK